MATLPSDALKAPQHEVQRLLGRCLLRLQQYGLEPECVWCEGQDKRYKILVHLILHGFGGSRSHGKMEVADALAYVQQRNQVPRRLLDFFPNLWRRIHY